MKKVLSIALFAKIALVAVFMITGWSASAQQIKLGYINSQELISLMPEFDSAQVRINAYTAEMQSMYESMMVEFNNKQEQFSKDQATLTGAARSQREKELTDLGTRLQTFGQEFQEEFEHLRNTIMSPIVQKAQDAVDKVGAANGFTAVFDLSVGALVYHDEKAMTDLLPLVKKELGINK